MPTAPSPDPPALPQTITAQKCALDLLDCRAVHDAGHLGDGTKTVVVDSGFYAHPYFAARGLAAPDVILGPGSSAAGNDQLGHGTGMCACLLAVAPLTRLVVIKSDPQNMLGALQLAIDQDPDVISCSWGVNFRSRQLGNEEKALAAVIDNAIARKIVVVAAGGNEGTQNFPAQHPDVIAVGGVCPQADGTLLPSLYTSHFESKAYSQRLVPDLCGISGNGPLGGLMVLPVSPGGKLDVDLSSEPDGTAPDDGWAVFSASSAAAAQLAGICALLISARRVSGATPLAPAELRQHLIATGLNVPPPADDALDEYPDDPVVLSQAAAAVLA